MKFFHVCTLTEAEEKISAYLKSGVVTLPLFSALGQTLAEDVISPDSLPPYDRSTVDGFAVNASEAYGASESVPSFFKITGRVAMGEMPSVALDRGSAVAIATGAVMPSGANAVVMIEKTQVLGEEIAVFAPVKMYENVVRKGEEVAIGEAVFKRGCTVTPFVVGTLAALGISRIKIYDKPKIALISTGDELVDVSEAATDGKIRDVNTAMLASFAANFGFEVVSCLRTKDDETQLQNALKQSVAVADVVLVSGGSSVGARDFTEKVLTQSGEIILHGVALKPGKPTVIAAVDGKLVYGLPGNPFAAAMTFKLLCTDVLRHRRGVATAPYAYAIAATNFPSSPGRTTVQPLRLIPMQNGFSAEPIFMKSAHLNQINKADGYTLLESNCEGVERGEIIPVYSFFN